MVLPVGSQCHTCKKWFGSRSFTVPKQVLVVVIQAVELLVVFFLLSLRLVVYPRTRKQ